MPEKSARPVSFFRLWVDVESTPPFLGWSCEPESPALLAFNTNGPILLLVKAGFRIG